MRDRPSLLHNMSVRPLTGITVAIGNVFGPTIGFSLARLSLTADAFAGFEPRLDEAWRRFALRGAALLYPVRDDASEPRIWADDPVLVLNVLARTRGLLLTAGAMPCGDPGYLERCLATDDPRLVALADAQQRKGGARCNT